MGDTENRKFILTLIFTTISLISPSETLSETDIPPNSLLSSLINPPNKFEPPIRLIITDKPLFIRPGEFKWLAWKVVIGEISANYTPTDSDNQEVTNELYMAYLRNLPTKESLRDITMYEKLIERVGLVGEEESYQLDCPIEPKAYPAMMLLWKVRIGEREEIFGPEPLDVIIWMRDENGEIKGIFDTDSLLD